MATMNPHQQARVWRDGFLMGIAALALGFVEPAKAQLVGGTTGGQQGRTSQAQPGQAPSQQPGSGQLAVVGQIRTVEQALRDTQRLLSGGQPANVPKARTAIDAGINVLARVPQEMQGEDAFRTALQEVNEARNALQGEQTNQAHAATQLREAADALGALAERIGGSAATSGPAGSPSR